MNDTEIKNLVKNRLREIRQVKNISVEDLAKILEMPDRTIRSYEQEERMPSVSLFIALHEKLSVNLNWLVSGKGSMFLTDILDNDLNEIISSKYDLSERDIKTVDNLIKFLGKN